MSNGGAEQSPAVVAALTSVIVGILTMAITWLTALVKLKDKFVTPKQCEVCRELYGNQFETIKEDLILLNKQSRMNYGMLSRICGAMNLQPLHIEDDG